MPPFPLSEKRSERVEFTFIPPHVSAAKNKKLNDNIPATQKKSPTQFFFNNSIIPETRLIVTLIRTSQTHKPWASRKSTKPTISRAGMPKEKMELVQPRTATLCLIEFISVLTFLHHQENAMPLHGAVMVPWYPLDV